MEFKTISEAKEYLSNLNSIVVPKEYTYFLHCTAFELPEEAAKNTYNRSWTQLPFDNFTVHREMSFVERKDRVYSALQYGGLHRAMTSYAKTSNSKPFQIRVVIPRNNLSVEEKVKLELNQEEYQKLLLAHSGGDYRHPKLKHGEIIEIFATSIIDEITLTPEDIFYGARQQDLIKYAQLVSEELELQNNIQYDVIPNNREEYATWINKTFSLPKNQNNYRYKRKYVIDKDGNINSFQYSDFEQDYLNELAQKQTANHKR